MRKRTAALIELDKEKRIKFQQVLRDFITDVCGEAHIPEEVTIIPDVEHSKTAIMQYGMESGNPFLMDPNNLKRILDAATFTFTWYEWDGELDEPKVTTPPLNEQPAKGTSGWVDASIEEKEKLLKDLFENVFTDDEDNVH